MASIPKPKPRQESSGGWIVTFADLMSLLLTFFILLLSFSKTDLQKYELIAKSLAESFGVSFLQGEGSGKGGSIIFADQPPPGEPAITESVDQQQLEAEFESFDDASPLEFLDEPQAPVEAAELNPSIEQLTENLVDELSQEIASKALSVSYDPNKVVVRFSDSATFTSGSADLKDEMFPILEKIEDVLAECSGNIVVTGYTDDLPVNSGRYRSNWDLSAARAVSVVHNLIINRKIDAERVSATGRAETNALVANDSADNRAKNRRVEISILEPDCGDRALPF